MQTSPNAVAADLPAARANLAAARSRLLRQYVGLGLETLQSAELWPQTTPARALARIARRDDDAACSIESLLGRPARKADISLDGAAAHQALASFLTARSRLLSAAARMHADAPLSPSSPAMRLLATCRDRDRRWARRLEWWKEEQFIPFEAGPRSILIAALRAARKELLTTLGLLPTEGRQQWRAQLLTLSRGEKRLLGGLRPARTSGAGHDPDALPDLNWEETWRVFHDTHHALATRLQGEETPDPVDLEIYRQVTASIDRDRAAAMDVRRSLSTALPIAAPGRPAAGAGRIRRPAGERSAGLPD